MYTTLIIAINLLPVLHHIFLLTTNVNIEDLLNEDLIMGIEDGEDEG